MISTNRPCFHEVTVVRKIVMQSECNFFSLPSLRENSDEIAMQEYLRGIITKRHKRIKKTG